MTFNPEEFKSINIYVNEEKDLVIFPISKTDYPIELADGTMLEYGYHVAYYPIELKYPYNNVELAEKIEYGIDQWDKHKAYDDFSGKNTFEEKYYGIKGFKKAIKGKRLIRLGWNEIQGKYVSMSFPLKSCYGYWTVQDVTLDKKSNWIDFADKVIEFIDLDIENIQCPMSVKNKFNL